VSGQQVDVPIELLLRELTPQVLRGRASDPRIVRGADPLNVNGFTLAPVRLSFKSKPLTEFDPADVFEDVNDYWRT
jgi:hypothetical protein